MRLFTKSVAAAVLAAFVLCGATAARAQVMDHVPSDALVVVKLNKLQEVNDKVAKWAAANGLLQFAPVLENPLGTLQEQMSVTEGVNAEGELAVVLTAEGGQGGQPGMLVLVPTSDYKAFLGNFGGGKPGATPDVTKIRMFFQELHVANWGDYAAISRTPEVLANKPGGIKLAGVAAQESEQKDLFVYANVPALRDRVGPMLDQAKTRGIAEIEKNFAKGENKKYAGLAKAAFGQVISVAETFLNDAESAGIGIGLTETGIVATVTAEFTPKTYTGDLAASIKNTEEPLVRGLPDRRYFVFGGGVMSPEVSAKVMGDILGPISKELAANPDTKQLAEAVDAMTQSMAATESFSFGMAVPEGDLGGEGGEPIMQQIAVYRGDAKTLQQANRKAVEATSAVMRLMPAGPAGAEGAPEFTFEMTEGAETIGGVTFDRFKVGMTVKDKAAARNIQMMQDIMWGPGGMGGVMGAVDDNTFLMVQGGTTQLVEQAVAAAKEGTGVPAQVNEVGSVDAQLPKSRAMVYYVAVDQIIRTGLKAADELGPGAPPFPLPDSIPPVAFTLASEGTAIRFDAVVPADLVRTVAEAAQQMAVQRERGPRRGGRGKGGADGL